MTSRPEQHIHIGQAQGDELKLALHQVLKHVRPKDIPGSPDLYSPEALSALLQARQEPDFSLIAVGDIMLGGRAEHVISERGAEYPFGAVLPLLCRAPLVLGNLEGPFARFAKREKRNHSYRVDPSRAHTLARVGINLVTLANNHLLDCGRAGVLETLDALHAAGVAAVGAGVNRRAAHQPVIRQVGELRIGVLGYYWNARCAATEDLPGSAMDPPEALAEDIRELRSQVDRVVVTPHWGSPYRRRPSDENQAKARLAIDCGADLVIGHHPHIVQPVEIHRGCPIIYSLGNFTFGSGNSRAEGLLAGVRFEADRTIVELYPLYVKNRDPRVNFQPKVLRGPGAARVLRRLVKRSDLGPGLFSIDDNRLRLEVPR